MSRENVELVGRLYHAVARGDAGAVLVAYHPEVEWDFQQSPFRFLLRHDAYRGHDGLRSFIRERTEDAWADIEDRLEELIDADDQVVSVVRSRGRGLASGAEVERVHAGIWTVRGGLIVRVAWVDSRDDALRAVGLRGDG